MSLYHIACGGTGGHLSPGIALAERLIDSGQGCLLLVSKQPFERRISEVYPNLSFKRIPRSSFSLSPLAFIQYLYFQVVAYFKALHLFLCQKPDIVFIFGGMYNMGIALAAITTTRRIVIHDGNRRPGPSLKFLKYFACRIYMPHGVGMKSIPSTILRHVSLPVRKEICRIQKSEARNRFGVRLDTKLLVVLAGSSGSRPLVNWIVNYTEMFCNAGITVYCITGTEGSPKGVFEFNLQNLGMVKAYFQPFTRTMGHLLSAADLVVSRSGAGTVAELTRCRVPSILVPDPQSLNEQQLANARFHEQQGCCIVVEEKNINQLYDEVMELIYNDWLLGKIYQNLSRLDKGEETDFIVEDLEIILGKLGTQKQPVSGSNIYI